MEIIGTFLLDRIQTYVMVIWVMHFTGSFSKQMLTSCFLISFVSSTINIIFLHDLSYTQIILCLLSLVILIQKHC
jgi:hypothetical protein